MKPTAICGFACAALAAAALALSTPAAAAVEDGIRAFKRGDYARAIEELGPAADGGDSEAQFTLGKIHEAGLGRTKDPTRAAALYKAAAEQDHPMAQHSFAYALFMGEGVEQDLVEALKWFILAARNGVEAAAAFGNRVSKILPRRFIIDARRAARQWREAHSN